MPDARLQRTREAYHEWTPTIKQASGCLDSMCMATAALAALELKPAHHLKPRVKCIFCGADPKPDDDELAWMLHHFEAVHCP